jgi:hypothetical protein
MTPITFLITKNLSPLSTKTSQMYSVLRVKCCDFYLYSCVCSRISSPYFFKKLRKPMNDFIENGHLRKNRFFAQKAYLIIRSLQMSKIVFFANVRNFFYSSDICEVFLFGVF